MKKFLFILGVLLTVMFAINNVSADLNYVDNETPAMEKYEDEFIDDNNSMTRAALTKPTEGQYDTIKDTKNAKGVMTERKFYLKSKLVEKRTYTQTGSTDCRMKNKYLYYSNGSTVYAHRTYSNTKDVCYNLQTKNYSTNSKIQSHLIYEGKVNGKVTERRDYEATGTYYTSKSYYKNGVLSSREYWKGAAGNYILEYGLFNSSGKNWTKLTTYYNSDKDIKEVINYTGTDPNKRKNVTGYDKEGDKTYYITYDANGDVFQKNLYDEDGYLTKEMRYFAGTGIWDWEIQYQEGNNKRDTVTYRDKGNKVIRKIRYFSDGTHLRWDINYVNGKKDLVKLYNSKYEYEKTYIYNDIDIDLEKIIEENNKEIGSTILTDIISDESLSNAFLDILDLNEDSKIYIEDFKIINKLEIENSKDNCTVGVEDSSVDCIESLDGIGFGTELEKITIKNSAVSDIPDDVKYLKKLKELDLFNNELSDIKNISKLEKLEIVNLASNNISDLNNAFNQMSNIKKINLNDNPISVITNEFIALKNTSKLEEVIINPNSLENLELKNIKLEELFESKLFFDENNKLIESISDNRSIILSNSDLKEEDIMNLENYIYKKEIKENITNVNNLQNFELKLYKIIEDDKEQEIKKISNYFEFNNNKSNDISKKGKYKILVSYQYSEYSYNIVLDVDYENDNINSSYNKQDVLEDASIIKKVNVDEFELEKDISTTQNNNNIKVVDQFCDKTGCLLEVQGMRVGETTLEVVIKNNENILKKEAFLFNVISNESQTRAQNKSMSPDDEYYFELNNINVEYGIKNSFDIDNLSEKDRENYYNTIENLKNKYFPDESIEMFASDKYAKYAGTILITKDSKTKAYRHGHAGIYSRNTGSTIEGISKEQGIKYVKGSISSYWKTRKKRTTRYSIRNTTRKKNINAALWAYKKKGSAYCLLGGKKCYNCVTLTTSAWKSQKVNITAVTSYYYTFWGAYPIYSTPLTPTQLSSSSNLKLVQTYHK